MLHRRRTAFVLLTACAGIVIGLSAMAIGITVEYLRKDAIRAAERESTNAALAVGDQLMRVIAPLDGLLTELRDVVPSLGIATPAEFGAFFSGEQQRQFFDDRLRRDGHAGVLAVLAADGLAIQASPAAARAELAEIVAEHLRRADRAGGYGLMVSPPIASRTAGQPMIYLGRRIAGSLGSHVGTVVVGLPAASLDRFYDIVPTLPGQSFVISRPDGTLLVNRREITQIPGPSMPEGGAWYETVAQGDGTFRVPAGNGRGDSVIVAVHLIPDTPFVVSSGMLESSALAEWRSHAVRIGAGALLAFVCAIGLL